MLQVKPFKGCFRPSFPSVVTKIWGLENVASTPQISSCPKGQEAKREKKARGKLLGFRCNAVKKSLVLFNRYNDFLSLSLSLPSIDLFLNL